MNISKSAYQNFIEYQDYLYMSHKCLDIRNAAISEGLVHMKKSSQKSSLSQVRKSYTKKELNLLIKPCLNGIVRAGDVFRWVS
jgi:hypothetical protein